MAEPEATPVPSTPPSETNETLSIPTIPRIQPTGTSGAEEPARLPSAAVEDGSRPPVRAAPQSPVARRRSRSRSLEKEPVTRLFVGGIDASTRVSDVEDLFGVYGRLGEITLKQNFCFVNIYSREGAERAIDTLNDTVQFADKRMSVEIARDRGAGRQADRRDERCFNCGEGGHWSKDCPRPRGRDICFECKRPGHIARECPDRDRSRSRGRGRYDRRDRSPYGRRDRSPYRRRSPRRDGRGYDSRRGYDDRGYGPPRGYDDRGYGPPRGHDDRGYGPPRGYDDRGYGPPRGYDDRGRGPPRGYDEYAAPRDSAPRDDTYGTYEEQYASYGSYPVAPSTNEAPRYEDKNMYGGY